VSVIISRPSPVSRYWVIRPAQPMRNSAGPARAGVGAASGWIMPIRRWPSRQSVIDHRQIARLENVQRHLAARQQQRTRQRKHRNDFGKISRAMIGRVDRHCWFRMC
jgi:hypothetical protein